MKIPFEPKNSPSGRPRGQHVAVATVEQGHPLRLPRHRHQAAPHHGSTRGALDLAAEAVATRGGVVGHHRDRPTGRVVLALQDLGDQIAAGGIAEAHHPACRGLLPFDRSAGHVVRHQPAGARAVHHHRLGHRDPPVEIDRLAPAQRRRIEIEGAQLDLGVAGLDHRHERHWPSQGVDRPGRPGAGPIERLAQQGRIAAVVRG
jgi:hypothetical protein